MQILTTLFCLLCAHWVITNCNWSDVKKFDDQVDWNSPSKPEVCNKFSNKVQTRKIDETNP